MEGRKLKSWPILMLVVALIGGLTGWAIDRPAAEVDQRTRLAPSGVVVSLSRPGGVEGAVMAGFPTPLEVEVISATPVVEIELRAGATIIDRLVLDQPMSAFTATLRWAPDEGLHVLTAQVFTADGTSGYSNTLNLFAADLSEALYALAETVAEEDDTLASIAAAFDVEVGHLQAANEELLPDQPITPGTTVLVPIFFTKPPDGASPTLPPEVQEIFDGAGPAPTEAPPLPESVVASNRPSVDVEVSVTGCVATLEFDTAGLDGDIEVVRIHQPSSNRIPVELEMDGSLARATHPLGTGVYDYLVELTTNGTRRLIGSARAFVDEPCGGSWTGPGKIVDGVLFLDEETIHAAYVYLSTGSNRWGRAPAEDQSAVPRGSHDGFDLNGHLPFLGDGPLEVEVWGWGPNGLDLVGNLEFHPTPGVDTSEALGGGRVSLWWIENAGGREPGAITEPEIVVTSGLVLNHATTLSFRWNSGIKPVTHVVWQVFPDAPPSDPSKIAPPGVLVQGTSENTPDSFGTPGSVFTLDLGALMAPWYQTAEVYIPDTVELMTGTTSPHSPILENLNISTHDEAAVAAGGVTGSNGYELWGGAFASQVPLEDPEVPGYDATAQAAGGKSIEVEGLGSIKFSPPKPASLYIRALAFSGDQYLGVASNDVHILLEEIPVIEDLTPAPGSYELEIDLKPLYAADLSKEYCVDLVGFDMDELMANYSDPAYHNAWHQWAWFFEKMGDGSGIDFPICAGCYDFGDGTFTIGPQKCNFGGGCPIGLSGLCALGGALVSLYDWAKEGFDTLKGWIVDAVVALSGCKHIGGVFSSDKEGVAAVCDGIATIAVNVALIYLGIPPSFPSSKELVDAAKGDVEAWLVSLAEGYGIPCDELSTLDEFVDLQGYTCEEMANHIVEEAIDQLLKTFSKHAQASMGLPSAFIVVPSAAGKLSPATVEVTVRTTENTPVHLTMCPAKLQMWSNWTPKIANPLDPRPHGAHGFFAHFEPPAPYHAGTNSYSLVPWGKYLGNPYEPVTFMLPQPGSARPGTEATTTVHLGVPVEYDWTTLWRGRPNNFYTDGYQWTPSDLNRIHLIGHSWATVTAWVSSSCAGFAGDDSIVFPHGLVQWGQ